MHTDAADGEPFLRRSGIDAGLTKHHLDGPAYQRLFGSVRVPATAQMTPEVLARAATLVIPYAVISHHSAARLIGGVVPEDPRVHVTVTSPRQRRCREGLVMHVNANVQTMQRGTLTITTPEQTFCDVAHEFTLVDLVVLGDSLVHRGVVDLGDLLAAAEASTDGSCALARQAAVLVREGVESPMESRVRLMMVLAGLPEPMINRTIFARDGSVTYRLDLSYPELRVAIEYDGRQHAEDAHQWGWNVTRREWLDDQQWRLLVLRACDVYDTPWATIGRIAAILASRGYEKPLPLQAPSAFRVHFPGRPWKVKPAS